MASEVETRDTPARDTWIGKHVRKPFKCKVATTHNQTTWRKFKSWTLWLIIDAKYQLGLGTCKLHTFATKGTILRNQNELFSPSHESQKNWQSFPMNCSLLTRLSLEIFLKTLLKWNWKIAVKITDWAARDWITDERRIRQSANFLMNRCQLKPIKFLRVL